MIAHLILSWKSLSYYYGDMMNVNIRDKLRLLHTISSKKKGNVFDVSLLLKEQEYAIQCSTY